MEKGNNTSLVAAGEKGQITAKLLDDYFATLTDKLTEVQRNQFAAVATAFGLNPFKREIYATTYRSKDGATVMSIVTGYEVYLKRAEMNPSYDGFETEFGVVDKQMNCTCRVYRKDRRMPITSTVWMAEYNTGRSLWNSKPKMMLEKVAIATAFRRAFPTDFGGMPYTTDELPEHMTGADKLDQQGYTEVRQAQAEQPAAAAKNVAETQDEKDANWLAMCDELRERNPGIFDGYLKQHSVPDLAEVRNSKDRKKLYTDIKATIEFAEKEADNA